ncbi:MAG: PEP-CTERM sorting domain-containing protein [Myxococcota bacterium]
MQFRNLALPFDEPMLITLHFAISGRSNAPAITSWLTVSDGIFGATFTPTFFGTSGGQTSCGLVTSSSCELSFIVPNGRGGFVSAVAQANAGVSAGDRAAPGSAAIVDLDFTHTIKLDLVEFRHNGQLLDPSSSRITAGSGTLYPLLPVPEPGTALLVGLGLAALGTRARAADRQANRA